MSEPSIPEGLTGFLLERIASYEELELLLLLRKESQGLHSVAELASALDLSEETALSSLERLAARGMCQRGGAARPFRYAPATPEIARRVDELARAYEGARLSVIRIMNENAVKRMRAAAIRSFADAFRLRKKK